MLLNSARSADAASAKPTRRSRMTAPSQTGTMIATGDLARTFKTRGGTVEAVRGVDREVRGGEIFGFLGPNGAGKSTTVRMLTTLLTITAGRAECLGVAGPSDPDGARARIGVALQESGLDPRQTGRELLNLHGRLF